MKRLQFASLAIAATAGLLALAWPSLPFPVEASAAVIQAEAVSIAIEPASASLAVGESVAVELRVNAGAQHVDKVDIFLDFNPAVLQAVDASGSAAASITPGTVLKQVRQNRVDAAAGQITYSACCVEAGSAATGPGSGSFVVASVRFSGVAAGSSAVSFSMTQPRATAVYAPATAGGPGPNILTGPINNGAVTVTGGAAPPAAAAPTITGPDDGVTVSDMAPLLRWNNPAGTTQYQVQVLPFNGDGPGINLIRNAETSFQVEAPFLGKGGYVMLPGMSYTWRVRTTQSAAAVGENDPAWGPWASRRFQTAPPSSDGIRPVAPLEEATLESRTPTLTWDNAARSVFYYEVQVSKDPAFTTDPDKATAAVYWNLVHGGQTVPRASYAIPASSPLDPASTYYWRVRPRVQGDGAAVSWSRPWVFHICCFQVTPDLKPRPLQCPDGLVGNAGFESPLAPVAGNWSGEDPAQGGVAGRRMAGTSSLGFPVTPVRGGDWSGHLFQGVGPTGQGFRSLFQEIPSLSAVPGYQLTFWIWPDYTATVYNGGQSEQNVSVVWDVAGGGVDAMVLKFRQSSTSLTGSGPTVTAGIPALVPHQWNSVDVVANAATAAYRVSVNGSTPVTTTGTLGNGVTATLTLGGGFDGAYFHDDVCLVQYSGVASALR